MTRYAHALVLPAPSSELEIALTKKGMMNIYKLMLLGIVCAFIQMFAGIAHAVITIDNFNDFNSGLWPLDSNANTPSASNSESGLTGTIGGERSAASVWQDGPNESITANVFDALGAAGSDGGVFTLSSDLLNDGLGRLSYGDSTTIGLNADLSSGVDFVLSIISTPQHAIPIELMLSDGSGNVAATSTIADEAGDLLIPVSNFSTVDLTDIDLIRITIDTPFESGISIDTIYLTELSQTQANVVPEPATGVMSLIGLVSLTMGSRRRHSRA